MKVATKRHEKTQKETKELVEALQAAAATNLCVSSCLFVARKDFFSYLCVSSPLRDLLSGTVHAMAVVLLFIADASAEERALVPPVRDPAKVVGPEQCAKCHGQELQRWMRTPHFATFDTLHRSPEAKQIAQRLGLRSIKRNDTCLQCHYTQQEQGERLRVVAGVSCESCHGAAADWLAVHADYGGAGVTKETETAEHRRERLEQSIAGGMNNPRNVYLIARQCYDCHTVPNEPLVNVGGHPAGSQDFELVGWSQGVVRHNFLRTGGTTNGINAPAELRVMYVVGVLADLEYSLRAAAVATEKAAFGITSAERAARMKRQLHEIQQLINEPVLQPSIDAVANLELRLGNSAAIIEAADEVGRAAYRFAEEVDGGRYSALDPLLPPPSQYKN